MFELVSGVVKGKTRSVFPFFSRTFLILIFWRQKISKRQCRFVSQRSVYSGWASDLYFLIRDLFLNEWYHKRPAVFVVGPLNVGKTSLVLKYLEWLSVFRPGLGEFFLSELDHSFDCILFDDFFLSNYPLTVLLHLLEGSEFRPQRKFRRKTAITWKKPVVILSNDDVEVQAFLVRTSRVQADNPCWSESELTIQGTERERREETWREEWEISGDSEISQSPHSSHGETTEVVSEEEIERLLLVCYGESGGYEGDKSNFEGTSGSDSDFSGNESYVKQLDISVRSHYTVLPETPCDSSFFQFKNYRLEGLSQERFRF